MNRLRPGMFQRVRVVARLLTDAIKAEFSIQNGHLKRVGNRSYLCVLHQNHNFTNLLRAIGPVLVKVTITKWVELPQTSTIGDQPMGCFVDHNWRTNEFLLWTFNLKCVRALFAGNYRNAQARLIIHNDVTLATVGTLGQ